VQYHIDNPEADFSKFDPLRINILERKYVDVSTFWDILYVVFITNGGLCKYLQKERRTPWLVFLIYSSSGF